MISPVEPSAIKGTATGLITIRILDLEILHDGTWLEGTCDKHDKLFTEKMMKEILVWLQLFIRISMN